MILAYSIIIIVYSDTSSKKQKDVCVNVEADDLRDLILGPYHPVLKVMF